MVYIHKYMIMYRKQNNMIYILDNQELNVNAETLVYIFSNIPDSDSTVIGSQ
jgi:hypothetical protein